MKSKEKKILEAIGIVVILLIIVMLFLLYPRATVSQPSYRVYEREVRNVPVNNHRSSTSSNGSWSTTSSTTSDTVQTQTTTYETVVNP